MRLIDADNLKAFIGDERATLHNEQQTFKAMSEIEFNTRDYMLSNFQYIIDNAPTVEERQAHWVVRDGYPHRVYCSLCNITFCDTKWEVWRDGSLPRYYCPNCGATMKGEKV